MFIRRATEQDKTRLAAFESRFAKRRGIKPVLWVSTLQAWLEGLIPDAPIPTESDRKAYRAGVQRALDCKDATGIQNGFLIGEQDD